MHEKTMLQWYAWERGHRIIYGVRFHCECAPIEAMWAYASHLLRQRLNGTPAVLIELLTSLFAYDIKPDVAARLFNRPTECWMLYTLFVCMPDKELKAGLSATDVFAIQRAYSGFGNTTASGSAHARSSVAGALADAEGDVDDLREIGEMAPPRGVQVAAPLPMDPLAAGAVPTASASVSAASTVEVTSFNASTVPPQIPDNLWELLSCVKEPARRAITDKRRKVPKIYRAFVDAVQNAWDTPSGRAVLQLLEISTLADMTPKYALEHSVVMCLGVLATLPCHPNPNPSVALPIVSVID
jgi:hypothetical protein